MPTTIKMIVLCCVSQNLIESKEKFVSNRRPDDYLDGNNKNNDRNNTFISVSSANKMQ